jgi:hypothetical protein
MECEAIRRTGSWSLQAMCRMESSLGSAGWRTLDSVVLSTSTFAICGTAENVLLEHAGPTARCPRAASPRSLMSANVLAAGPGSHAHAEQRVLSSAPLRLCLRLEARRAWPWQTAAAGCLNNVRSASVEGEGLGSRKCLKLDCNLKAVHGARQCTSYPSSARTLQRICTVFERVSGAPSPPAVPLACVCSVRPRLPWDHRHHRSRSSPAREHPTPPLTSTATLPLCHRVLSAPEGTRSSSTRVRLRTANFSGHSHRVFP